MGFAAGTMAGVPGMQVGFIRNVEALWREGGCQLLGYEFFHLHGA
jgi:hypothetical protein